MLAWVVHRVRSCNGRFELVGEVGKVILTCPLGDAEADLPVANVGAMDAVNEALGFPGEEALNVRTVLESVVLRDGSRIVPKLCPATNVDKVRNKVVVRVSEDRRAGRCTAPS